MKEKFIKVLKQFGFKKLTQHQAGVFPYQRGDTPENSQYAEVMNHTYSFCVWMPDNTYNGRFFFEEEKLKAFLTEKYPS